MTLTFIFPMMRRGVGLWLSNGSCYFRSSGIRKGCDQRTQPEGLSAPVEECNQPHPIGARFWLRASTPVKMLSFPVARTTLKFESESSHA